MCTHCTTFNTWPDGGGGEGGGGERQIELSNALKHNISFLSLSLKNYKNYPCAYETTLIKRNSYITIVLQFRLAHLCNVSEEAFLRAVNLVMLSLIDNVDYFIHWPEKDDYT